MHSSFNVEQPTCRPVSAAAWLRIYAQERGYGPKVSGPPAPSGATKLSPRLGSPTFLKLSGGGDMRRAARAVPADVDVVRGRRRAWTQLSRSCGERQYRPPRGAGSCDRSRCPAWCPTQSTDQNRTVMSITAWERRHRSTPLQVANDTTRSGHPGSSRRLDGNPSGGLTFTCHPARCPPWECRALPSFSSSRLPRSRCTFMLRLRRLGRFFEAAPIRFRSTSQCWIRSAIRSVG